jgi:two-component system, OmpR family, copper resistance phosphate regulon response regulator CusR
MILSLILNVSIDRWQQRQVRLQMRDMPGSLLIVDDDPRLASSLSDAFTAEGWTVHTAADGSGADARLLTGHRYHCIILDLGLPGADGWSVLHGIRSRGDTTPVLMLTARVDIDIRVKALDGGADDYVPKPFAVEEVLARVRALTRRTSDHTPLVITIGDLEVDLIGRRVRRANLPLELTNREFSLVSCLARVSGRVVSRDHLAREVWGETVRATPIDNVIDVHMARLRKKLDASGIPLLHTVRGVGYRLSVEPPGNIALSELQHA